MTGSEDWKGRAKETVKTLIGFIGDNPERNGLRETPERVVRSWQELFSGYAWSDNAVSQMLTAFDGEGYEELIILRNIDFASTCEHHLLPFIGTASVGYIPKKDGKIAGVSKLARLLEIYSRRLQIQERICRQVTHALIRHLDVGGAACVITAKHCCISCRGIDKQSAEMVTSSMEGCFRSDEKARSEFLRLIGE